MQAELRLPARTRLFAAAALTAAFAAGAPVWAQGKGVAAPTPAPTMAADPALEAEVHELAHKLRCLVCQNQSIAESNAPLAVDLRNQVREQLAAGRSKSEILDYLVARYGDFVLYEPPLKATTLLLWGGPAVLLLAAAGGLAYRLRTRARETAAQASLSASERSRARDLLSSAGSPEPAPSSAATRESRT